MVTPLGNDRDDSIAACRGLPCMSPCLSQHSSASSGVGSGDPSPEALAWWEAHAAWFLGSCGVATGGPWQGVSSLLVSRRAACPVLRVATSPPSWHPEAIHGVQRAARLGVTAESWQEYQGQCLPTKTQRIITGKKTSARVCFRNRLVPSSASPGGEGNWGGSDGQPVWPHVSLALGPGPGPRAPREVRPQKFFKCALVAYLRMQENTGDSDPSQNPRTFMSS